MLESRDIISIVSVSLFVIGGLSGWILSLMGRIVRLETQHEGLNASLVRIERKLDRLIERNGENNNQETD